MSKGKKIGGIILIILGTIALLIGIVIGGLFGVMNSATDELNAQVDELRANTVSTDGKIIDIDDESMATIEFYCKEDGYWYDAYIMVLSDNYQVGDIVEVCYDPNAPSNAPIAPELLLEGMDTIGGVGTGIGVVIGVIGLIMIVIGIVLLVSNKKDKKWTDEINARNAAMGIGTVPNTGYQPMPGGQPMGGYGQPLSGYNQSQGGQPLSGYNQPQNAGQTQTDANTSNPYRQ